MDLQELIKKKSTLKGTLTRHKNYISGIDSASVSQKQIREVGLRREKLQYLLDEFDNIQSQIESLDEETDIAVHEKARDEFEKNYYSTLASFDEFAYNDSDRASSAGGHVSDVSHASNLNAVNNIGLNSDNTNVNNISASLQHIKLPQISLPTFSGQIDMWTNFLDMFNSLIHCNDSLSPVQKYQYLKSSLTGDAASIIQSLEINDNNYLVAYDLLKARYEDKDRLINSHLKSLFELETVTKESYSSLQSLLNDTQKHVRALKTLNEPVQHWNSILIFLTRSKLDNMSKRDWEKYKADLVESPTLEDLSKFLMKKCQMLETIHTPTNVNIKRACVVVEKTKCKICNSNIHPLYHCDKFLKMSVKNRIDEVSRLKLCKNCFRASHPTKFCNSSCCRKCNQRHNTLLHLETTKGAQSHQSHQNSPDTSSPSSVEGTSTKTVVNLSNNFPFPQVLLPTATAYVYDQAGNRHTLRILLDSGSQSNFICEDAVTQLGLYTRKINISISGINNAEFIIKRETELTLYSKTSSYKINIQCLIVPKITDYLPQPINPLNLDIPPDAELADPNFSEAGNIQVLIGSEIFWSLLCMGKIHLNKRNLSLVQTKLGWLVSGPINPLGNTQNRTCLLTLQNEIDIQKQLAAFWQIEEVHSKSLKSKDEDSCEILFDKTTQRSEDGKFVVHLPFKIPPEQLGESYSIALKRYTYLEKKLSRDLNLKNQYCKFISEYIQHGHMSIKHYSKTELEQAYFLPHHAVLKPNSLTSKLRTVFDAGCTSASGVSLNDLLLVGPVVQPDLFTIICRFRLHKVAFTSDIEKMYRQIWVLKNHRFFQNIIWEGNTYQLNTVTYGTSCAPYLATRCLLQIAIDCEISHPRVSQLIKNSFYVDDLISSCQTEEEAKFLIETTIKILQSYGFPLKKWKSNNPRILSVVDSNDTITQFSDSNTHKTLGLLWESQADALMFEYNPKNLDEITKRTVLSVISSLFDPLGLISPILVTSKVVLQRLWQLNLKWDDPLPPELHKTWVAYQQELSHVSCVKISRQVLCDHPVHIELHAFSDASEISYGTCIYLRSTDSFGRHQVSLLCAKGRVAPLKVLTIPKLELMAAHLMARLVSTVLVNLSRNITIDATHLWCDSTIVLAWLRRVPNQLKTFVAHRVADILSLSDIFSWHHVRSAENPADILSRGEVPRNLVTLQLWWQGPSWLSQDSMSWPLPISNTELLTVDVPEIKIKSVSMHTFPTNPVLCDLLSKYSSLNRTQRVLAYCIRFIANCKSTDNRKFGVLEVTELNTAITMFVRFVQEISFADDLSELKSKKHVSRRSNLISLNPFLDENQLIRVGGRIRHSNESFDKRFPCILPRNHPLVTLIISHYHSLYFHAGAQITINAIRQRFWIISCRTVVKIFIHNCVTCKRFNATAPQMIMGDLPESRVTPSRPFSVCGTDFAGPFMIREHRSRRVSKAYLCVFLCFSTKAVHLDIVSSLSTEAFLACLKRFLARRGFCREIHSDNGTNYVGANREIKDWYNFQSKSNHSETISEFLTQFAIQWKFTPARSPNFGGLWESIVKSVKRHLYKVTINTTFTFEELSTLFIQIEAVLNSRPLIPFSSDPDNFHILTPGHFLVGDSLIALPEPCYLDMKQNRLSKYKLIQQMYQRFWKLWSHDYLTLLQTRSKWRHNHSNLVPGTLVLIQEPQSSPLLWRRGRIICVHPGTDNVVRVVSVKTSTGVVKRAVNKLVPLLVE